MGIKWSDIRNKLWWSDHNLLILLARLKGFEPLTYGLEVRCSIQLSYRRAVLLLVIC